MNSIFSRLVWVSCLFAMPFVAWADDYRVFSPDSTLAAIVYLEQGKLYYSVTKNSKLLVAKSPLGLTTNRGDFSDGNLSYVSHTVDQLDETYTLTTGKRRECRNQFSQLTLTVNHTQSDWNMSLLFRLYDDGFAFRYVIPKKGTLSRIQITSEASRIIVSNFNYCLGCRFQHPDNYCTPNIPYESNYGRYVWKDLQGHGYDARLNAPALVSSGSQFLLISEAANVGAYSTSLLRAETQEGEFSFAYADDTKDMVEDKPHSLTVKLPLRTPWRMAAVGSLSDVFETVITENLNAPNVLQDTTWIRPGWVAWDWGGVEGGPYKPSRFECVREYVDLAVEMGWPYMLVDGGWRREEMPEILEYARFKKIDVLLWQTADLDDSQDFSFANMARTLDEWKSWGIRGVKVDFWEDDSRTTMERMELLLKLCAERQMLVNFHGCTRPSGLRRTYPHLMTQEGIMGGEQNFWNNRFMDAEHHINLFFTRNVVGAADYTPGDMVDTTGILVHRTSVGHRMALLVAFESGLQHMAEDPYSLRYFEGRDIMKRIPTVWDETRLVEGNVSQYATIARRSGEDWWLAGTSVSGRYSQVQLDFLQPGKTYTAYIYRDGGCRSALTFERRSVDSNTKLTLRVLLGGGYLVQISPKADLPVPYPTITYEAESTSNVLSSGVTVNSEDPVFASGGKQVNNLGLGRKLVFNKIKATHGPGRYVLSMYYTTADDRSAEVLVNNKSMGLVRFGGNHRKVNTYGPQGMGVRRMEVELQEGGQNSITLLAPHDNWSPNFDRITLTPLSTSGVGIPSVQADAKPLVQGTVYDLDGRVVAQDMASFQNRKGIYVLRDSEGRLVKKLIR